jgi:hypothetical protein
MLLDSPLYPANPTLESQTPVLEGLVEVVRR